MMGDLAIRGIPDHLVHGYQFLNHPIHRYLHYAMRVRYIFYMCGISYLVIIHCMHAGMYVCMYVCMLVHTSNAKVHTIQCNYGEYLHIYKSMYVCMSE